MKKIDEISDPNSCFNKAKNEELLFILLDRDDAAPFAIRQWAVRRIELGLNQPNDPQIKEAFRMATLMEEKQFSSERTKK